MGVGRVRHIVAVSDTLERRVRGRAESWNAECGAGKGRHLRREPGERSRVSGTRTARLLTWCGRSGVQSTGIHFLSLCI